MSENKPNTLNNNNIIGGGQNTRRSAGLDIVRCAAILFVIASHFFLNTNAATTIFTGFWLFPQGMLRTLFLTNVPLFLILTGYLNLNKTISRKYYRGMIGVLLSYLVISAITILFRIRFMGEHLGIAQWILKVTDFSAISYAWYIEMWIGLYLLTPFLNILWRNIASRRHKHILLITMYLLSALPDMFNRYGVHLMPGYWEMTYPLAFYFIGAYIREYKPQIKSSRLLLAILGCTLINPLFNFLFVKNHSMIQVVGDGNGIVGIPLATMVFMVLFRIDIAARWLRRMLESISRLSLDMYLFSYMLDVAVYAWLKPMISINPEQSIVWFFVAVPIVFVGAYILSALKSLLFRLLRLPTR